MHGNDVHHEVTVDPSRPVQVVHDTTTVAEALLLMRRARVRHLPVVRRGRCVGVLVDVDLVAAAVDGVAGAVGPLARRPVPTVALGADAPATARAIVAGGMDAALVMEDSIVVGIVTSTDVLEGLAALGRSAVGAQRAAGLGRDVT